MIRDAAAEKGDPLPPLLHVTDLDEELDYWQAFAVLHKARGFEVGVGGAIEKPIRYSEISAYAHDWGFASHPLDFRLFILILQNMDEEYRRFSRELSGG